MNDYLQDKIQQLEAKIDILMKYPGGFSIKPNDRGFYVMDKNHLIHEFAFLEGGNFLTTVKTGNTFDLTAVMDTNPK